MAHLVSPIAYRQGKTFLWGNVESHWATRLLMKIRNALAISCNINNNKLIYGHNKIIHLLLYPLIHIHQYWRKRSRLPRPYKKAQRVIGYVNESTLGVFGDLLRYTMVRYDLHHYFPSIPKKYGDSWRKEQRYLEKQLRDLMFRGSKRPTFYDLYKSLVPTRFGKFWQYHKPDPDNFLSNEITVTKKIPKMVDKTFPWTVGALAKAEVLGFESNTFKFFNLRDWRQNNFLRLQGNVQNLSDVSALPLINPIHQDLSEVTYYWLRDLTTWSKRDIGQNSDTYFSNTFTKRLLKTPVKVYSENVFKYLSERGAYHKGVDQLHYWENRYKARRFTYVTYFDLMNALFLQQYFFNVNHLILEVIKYTLFKMHRRNLKVKPYFYFLHDVLKNTFWFRLLYEVFRIIVAGKLQGGTARTKIFSIGYGRTRPNSLGAPLNFSFDTLRSKYGSYGIKILSIVSEDRLEYDGSNKPSELINVAQQPSHWIQHQRFGWVGSAEQIELVERSRKMDRRNIQIPMNDKSKNVK